MFRKAFVSYICEFIIHRMHMEFNFNEKIDRSSSHAMKYMALERFWGRKDLLPLWVADMDFKTPPFIMEAIRKRLEHEVLGYTCPHDGYYSSIIRWNEQRYGMIVDRNEIKYIPGVVAGIFLAIQTFTEKGDKILIQQPVYHPFAFVPQGSERTVVNNPLRWENGRYEMDLEDLREKSKGCRLMILCNPHNPGGVLWSKETLQAVADICQENGVIVVSDEIHGDMMLQGRKHLPFASVSQAARDISITLQAPTKAFNMPGIVAAHALVYNETLRKRYFEFIERSDMDLGNVFAFLAVEAVYTQGEDWLEQMLEYVQKNINYVDGFLQENCPLIKAVCPEASFLVWLDCRALNFENQAVLEDFFADKAHLALNSGTLFGENGQGFMRLNVGCPRCTLEQAMTQLKEAYMNLPV